VGRVRVGIARSDPEGLLAVPVATVARDEALVEISRVVEELNPLELVVGLPLSLSGLDTVSTEDARAFAELLAAQVEVSVRMVDERLSTVEASAGLSQAGKSQKQQRAVIDQVAAVILLQHALDSERLQGVEPGHLIQRPA
jgi:putative Holliday junction resolvase